MSNFELDEIVSIEYIGKRETIDINVSGNKLFYANGILTHNSAMEETDHEMYHIAGGISKINTADNVMTIYTSNTLKEQGAIRLQFIKTRSSSGVGQRVFLSFDASSMRITDADSDEIDDSKQGISDLGEKFKRKAKIESAKEADKDDADAKPNVSGGNASIRAKTSPKRPETATQLVSAGRDVRAIISQNRAQFSKSSD